MTRVCRRRLQSPNASRAILFGDWSRLLQTNTVLAAICVGVMSWLAASTMSAADPPPDDAVAARVNGKDISVRDVKQMMIRAAGPHPEASAQALLAAQALEQLIQQSLVAGTLDVENFTVPDAEIDAAIEKMKQKAEARQKSLNEILADQGLDAEGVRRGLIWEVRWNKYADEKLKDAELEAYFRDHAREFDGSEVRVSHILLRPGGVRDAAAMETLVRQALQLRSELAANRMTFAEAARKFSAGPSRQSGGDLGFIPRRDVMAEPFSKAAFALEVGQISQPVLTPFGVHLILVTEIKPGSKSWTEARELLKPAATAALFDKMAADARADATIEYTGVVPHIDPQTRQLVK